MSKDTQCQDWDLNLVRLLDAKACSQPPTHSSVVAVDFRILGQPWTRCGKETDCVWVVTADLSATVPTFASRLRWKHSSSLKVANEPILAFTQGSPEREALQKVREGRGPPVGAGHGAESAFSSPSMLLCAYDRHPLPVPALGGSPASGESCVSGGWERLGAAG